MKDWRLADPKMQSPEEKKTALQPSQQNPDYHQYSDSVLDDEDLRESLSNEGTQVPTRDFGDGFSMEVSAR